MGLYGMMRTSASGMTAQESLLSTVSDNIANAGTTGYKRSSQEFSTIVLEQAVAGYQSGSVNSRTRTFISEQGAFNFTSSNTDLAIEGAGFFIVRAANGAMSLTRAGAFAKNGEGNLVNAAGGILMAYPTANGTTPVANGMAGLQPVNIGTLAMVADPSTAGRLYLNLPPASTIVAPANLPSANAPGAAFTRTTSIVAYDNIGAPVTLDIYETKTAANTWEIAVFDRAAASSGGTFPYTSGPLTTATLSFDPATGSLASSSATSLTIPIPNGASLALDMSRSSELPTDYAIRDVKVNGSPPSDVDRVEITRDGQVVAVYKNGFRSASFQIPLATVPSSDKLLRLTGNTFGVSKESGDLIVGLPGKEGLGSTVSGALEKSTVDIATELTTMIESQHTYTANSKVFQTAADLMEVLINLKR